MVSRLFGYLVICLQLTVLPSKLLTFEKSSLTYCDKKTQEKI
jgi:hypothetical protein